MPVLGAPSRNRLLAMTTTGAAIPRRPATYTSTDGGVIIPAGWGSRSWHAYRIASQTARKRGDVIVIGDSTSYGSGGLYAWQQRIRDRAAAAGFTDGGKGMVAGGESQGIAYDAPEVNSFVSTTFVGSPDGYDNTDGQYWYDTGAQANLQLNLRFRATGARLWYSQRGDAASFTYSVNGAAATTVTANGAGPVSKYVPITGLAANTTHTLTVTNLATGGGAGCWIALAPVNATGLTFQKYATSGDTINQRFYRGIGAAPWTSPDAGNRYQSPFGLVPGDQAATSSPPYTGAARASTFADINPVLGIFDLGFNDLSAAGGTDINMWTEYVKIAAGTCYDAGCDCLILSGQLPYNANWPAYGAARFNAVKAQALASGAAFVDLFLPVGGPSLSYAAGTTDPHLTKTQYQAQADYLWDNLLGL